MRLITLLAFIILPLAVTAAPGSPPPPTPPPPPPPGLPVDGGIVALLIVSLCYGLYKIYQWNSYKKAQL
ncbi:MAG: hypothetical protein EOP46_18460 [Sphingobacteriaceae bacterium]|nr:MAG: hypothetical protein EOP46_18460 [Sphingobacteriaceae bacterium]